MPHPLSLALVVALVVAGCGGDSDPGSSSGADAQATSSPTPTPTPEPVTKADVIKKADKRCKTGSKSFRAAFKRFTTAFDAGSPAVISGDTAGAKKLYARAADALEQVLRYRKRTTRALREQEAPPEGGPEEYVAARQKVDAQFSRVVKLVRRYSRTLSGPVAREIDDELPLILYENKLSRAQTRTAKAYGLKVCSAPDR